MSFQLPLPDSWKFDLVALLAILGESSINEVVYPLTAWPLVWLPRLLPAPQALILPKRKSTLPSNPNARVVGAFSGNVIEQLPYFADALHSIDTLEPNAVQVVQVDVVDKFERFVTRRLPVLGRLTIGPTRFCPTPERRGRCDRHHDACSVRILHESCGAMVCRPSTEASVRRLTSRHDRHL
jgi:hypothetical protein